MAVNHCRLIVPRSPVPVKYSALARKATWRGAVSGITTLSANERWLLARMTGPVGGTLSAPTTSGRHNAIAVGRATTWSSR